MTELQPAWESAPSSPSHPALALLAHPADLYMSRLDPNGQVVLVSFSLGRLATLTRTELEVARWANAGHANAVIARERQTAVHTVARQMHSVIRKLGISSRLGLATLPELSAWSPPGSGGGGDGGAPVHSPLMGLLRKGSEVEPQEVACIWREIASGPWSAVAGVDAGGMRHAVMSRDSARDINWCALSKVHRQVLALTAMGLPQKCIAIKLGLAPSTVSGLLRAAHKRVGFEALGQLLRAYCASVDVLELIS